MKIKTIKFNFIIFSILLTPIIYAASDSAEFLLKATDNGNVTEVINIIKDSLDPNGNIAEVINIIKDSLDPNGNIAEVINIVKNNLDTRTAMEFGKIALLVASKQGHYKIVEYLLKTVGIGPNTYGSDYKTPLMLASMNGHFNIVDGLLSLEYIDPNLQDNFGNTALILAIMLNQKKIANIILKHPGTKTNISNIAGESALMKAVQRNLLDIVKQLLAHKNKVNPNYLQGDNEQTPLMLASVEGHFKIVECLLSLEYIDPNLQDNFGNTALILAIMLNQKKIANIIWQHPKTNMSNITDKSAPMKFYIVQQFLAHENGTIQVKNGPTPLIVASYQGDENLVKLLIQNNADTNSQDIHRQSALIVSSCQGHERIVESLLRNNANPILQNMHGQTALTFAKTHSIFKTLKQAMNIHETLKQLIRQPKKPLTALLPFLEKEQKVPSVITD